MSLLFNRKGFERVSQEDSDTFLHLEEGNGASKGAREWESKEKGVVGSTTATHSTTSSDSQVPLHTHEHMCNHVCDQICCHENSNFKAVYTPSDTAAHSLTHTQCWSKAFHPSKLQLH